MKKIEDLQRIVNMQNNRISTLEKRPIDADVQPLIQLQSTITTQNEQIFQLEERVRELEATLEMKITSQILHLQVVRCLNLTKPTLIKNQTCLEKVFFIFV